MSHSFVPAGVARYGPMVIKHCQFARHPWCNHLFLDPKLTDTIACATAFMTPTSRFHPSAMIQSEPIYSLKGKRVWVAGHNVMVGSALVRRLAQIDCTILTTARNDLDLTRQAEVE